MKKTMRGNTYENRKTVRSHQCNNFILAKLLRQIGDTLEKDGATGKHVGGKCGQTAEKKNKEKWSGGQKQW